jgi:hypothetical protein
MFEFNDFVTGYTPAGLALLFVFVYFVFVSLILRIPGRKHISVPRYEPPAGASPGVAAWLCGRGRLPRAMAASFVNMAAKGFLKIEQFKDFVSLTRLKTGTSAPLEPEEDALSRSLFHHNDYFDFSQTTPQLADAIEAFRLALLGTQYFSPHTGLSIPAWTISGLATVFALYRGNFNFSAHGSIRSLGYVAITTIACFVLGTRTLSGTLEKIGSRLPGSTAPRRPWIHADTRPFLFLVAALVGVSLIAWMSAFVAALLTAAFMVLNALFFFALQGPTSAGKKILAQLNDYKKFMSEVDADAVSRVHPAERVPAQLQTKDAYAVAFHLDLGWGEQFATSIADVVERAEMFEKTSDDDSPTLITS